MRAFTQRPEPYAEHKLIDSEEQFREVARMLESDLHSAFALVFTHKKPVPEGSIRLASVLLRK